jgi:hypothetical protein
MKKSIIYGAVGILMSLGVGSAATPKLKPHSHSTDLSARAGISIIPLRDKPGFALIVDKPRADRSVVIISSQDESFIYKNVLTDGSQAEKKYILSQLDAGNYTVEIHSKGHDIKTQGKVIFVQ